MRTIQKFLTQQWVFVIALILASISIVFVPISSAYLTYFDWPTLACLWTTMLVISAFRRIYIFEFISKLLIRQLNNTRRLVVSLVVITFVASMFLANDMALLTFLPLTLIVFRFAKKESYSMFTIIMQNIAANLGGMLTPFGNPQNLYLYSHFNIDTLEFFQIMSLPFIVSIVSIIFISALVRKEPLETVDLVVFQGTKEAMDQLAQQPGLVNQDELPTETLNIPKTIIYSILFVASILMVFRSVPYVAGTLIISAIILFMDKASFKDVDYGLMLTFIMFFIFSSNLSRIPEVQNFFVTILNKSVLLTGVISCQIISNVPSAILLSRFLVGDLAALYPQLLVAVNIGGVGTLVSSLASLISFRKFSTDYPKQTLKYLGLFSVINFSFLIGLTILMYWVF